MTIHPDIAAVLAGERRWALAHGDCLDVLRTMPDSCVDSMSTDPPSSIRFMNKKWDTDHGDPLKFARHLAARLREAMRVMKPGAHGWVWGLPRTSYLTGLACHLAGFEVRDRLHHVFGSGMPHTLNVSKAIDEKLLGKAEAKRQRPVLETYRVSGNALTPASEKGGTYGVGAPNSEAGELTRTSGATREAKAFDGWHTGLKPGCEDWWLVRKPFKGTLANNVLRHGVGGLNIDACRIPRNWDERGESWKQSGVSANPDAEKIAAPPGQGMILHPAGGWPSNIAFTHSAHCEDGGSCADDCPVAELNRQGGWTKSGSFREGGTYARSGDTPVYGKMSVASGATFGDEGPVSRYFNVFYQAKPSRSEKDDGCEHLPAKSGGQATNRKDGVVSLNSPQSGAGRTGGARNHHPTVKGETLMEHLCALATPPRGIVIDLFGGSGTTCVAALRLGFRCVIIEQEAEYLPIIRARIVGDSPLFNREGL